MFIVKDDNGNKVKWDNGKFSSNNTALLTEIRKKSKQLSKMGCGVSLDGTTIAAFNGVDFEKNQFTAYALLEHCLHIVEVKGHRPSILELYPQAENGDKQILY